MSDSSLRDVDLDIRSVRVLCDGRAVGTLALSADGVLAFEYDDAWLGEGFSISRSAFRWKSACSSRSDIRSMACSVCSTIACLTDGGVCWSIGCFDLTASIRSP